ncbi:MAG: copper chaperone PCu(A)C [Gammaproteobacteria bacterium]|nr:MAG: copper chaperone PCu(A)C [Gammaproteobacteria bacterium]
MQMKSINSIITCFFFIFLLTNSVLSAENIHVQNAWIREAPPAIKVMAGYLDIENSSDRALTLVSAESPEFERIEFHISQTKNGVASMQQQEHIIIAPDSTLSFEPGAYHLMLFNPSVPMREGKRISIKLTFEDGKTLSFDAIVRRSNLTAIPHQHDHRH